MINRLKSISLKNVIIFFGVTFFLFLLDWLTKTFIFDINKENIKIYENFLFGFRSVSHNNSTFFSSINLDMPSWVNDIIFILMILIILMIFLFVNKKRILVCMAFLFAGILGNGFDQIIFDYVRDIIYIPWVSNGSLGTFNLADTFIIIGAILILVFMLIDIFKEEKQNKKNKIKQTKEKND